MNRKRLIVIGTISIILVCMLFIGTTYSIFTSNDIDPNANVYTTGNLDITYTLSSDNINFTDATPVSDDKVEEIKPYRITVNNMGNVDYKFNIILTDTTATDSINYDYIMTQVGKLDSISLSSTTNNIIKSDVIIKAGTSVPIDIRIYLSSDIPNTEVGKNFAAKLSIDGIAVSYDKGEIDNSDLIANETLTVDSATDKVINLYNDGSTINTVNIGGSSSKPQVKLNATQGIMLDNNGDYRYYGANPNNYVTFNGEAWRIIGAFNNVDDGTGKKETRLKIIRNNSIGNYSYDSSASDVNSGYGVNDWSKADLNTELNTLYYNSTSGTCYNGTSNSSTSCDFSSTGLGSEARSMIDNAVYHLGGSSSYEGLYANDYYTFERGTTVYDCSTDDGACPRSTAWTGKVGLMYPSDYAYATDLSLCTKDGYNYDNTNCKSNDWLFNDAIQWTIAPYSSNASRVFRVTSTGYVNRDAAYSTFGVRPAVYLKSNVAIVSGEGTSSNPYQLELS